MCMMEFWIAKDEGCISDLHLGWDRSGNIKHCSVVITAPFHDQPDAEHCARSGVLQVYLASDTQLQLY